MNLVSSSSTLHVDHTCKVSFKLDKKCGSYWLHKLVQLNADKAMHDQQTDRMIGWVTAT